MMNDLTQISSATKTVAAHVGRGSPTRRAGLQIYTHFCIIFLRKTLKNWLRHDQIPIIPQNSLFHSLYTAESLYQNPDSAIGSFFLSLAAYHGGAVKQVRARATSRAI